MKKLLYTIRTTLLIGLGLLPRLAYAQGYPEFYYCDYIGKPCLNMNANSTYFGQIGNLSATEWFLGHGATKYSRAVTALKWNTAGNVTATYGLSAATGTFTGALSAGSLSVTGASGLSVTYGVTAGSVTAGLGYFGQGATKSTFSADGSLALDANSGLTLGTTLYVDNGRIGVGITTPVGQMHLEGAPTGSIIMRVNDADGYGFQLKQNALDTNWGRNGSSDFYIGLNGYQGGATQFRSTWFGNGKGKTLGGFDGANDLFKVGVSSLVVLTSGNVGIGTTNPISALHTYRATENGTILETDTGGSSCTYYKESGNNRFLVCMDGSVAGDPLKFYDYGAGAELMRLVEGKVGIGTTNPSSKISLQMGSGTGQAAVGGMAYVTTTSSATEANTSEMDFATYTLPANSLAVNGQGVRIRAWGYTANNANVKTIKLYFGTAFRTQALTTNSGATWIADMTILRTGASAEAYFDQITHGTAILETGASTDTTALGSDVTIKVTGTNGAASASDIVMSGMTVEFLGK